MKANYYLFAAISAVIVVLAAIGFTSPGTRMGQAESEIKEIKKHLGDHDSEFARVNTKLDYLTGGVSELLRRKRGE